MGTNGYRSSAGRNQHSACRIRHVFKLDNRYDSEGPMLRKGTKDSGATPRTRPRMRSQEQLNHEVVLLELRSRISIDASKHLVPTYLVDAIHATRHNGLMHCNSGRPVVITYSRKWKYYYKGGGFLRPKELSPCLPAVPPTIRIFIPPNL